MALTDLIKLNKHRPVRRLYIKRRLTIDGSYESDWQRIDNWNGQNIIIDWGTVSINIDEQPGTIAAFDISELSLIVNNNDGLFNVESYDNSIWYPESTYLNRRYTKVKIETAYLDENDSLTYGSEATSIAFPLIDAYGNGDGELTATEIGDWYSAELFKPEPNMNALAEMFDAFDSNKDGIQDLFTVNDLVAYWDDVANGGNGNGTIDATEWANAAGTVIDGYSTSTTDFEGFIESIIISEDGLATINILSYQNIFTKYPISDLSLTGSGTASSVVTAICNQSKITTYMPYVIPSLGYDYTITDKSLLDGTYWDILQEIAFKSNSTIFLENNTFKLVERTGGSVVWNFKGSGSDEPNDIISINDYDDEGIGKVRVYWKEKEGSTFAKSSDTTLLLKYLSEPELVDLTNIDSDDKQDILNALLTKWEPNRPSISFDCKFLLNRISLLDKITMEIRGRISPSFTKYDTSITTGYGFRWDCWTWDDGSIWSKEIGGIIISSGTEWVVTQIVKDFQNWKMTIRAERVV